MSSELRCTTCAADLVSLGEDVAETMVGYGVGACGRPHNDNCLTRVAFCARGHRTELSLRRTCESCDWRGKTTCFCHGGEKLDAWPDLPVRNNDRGPMIEAKSALSGALVAACPQCQAAIGEPCKRADGQLVAFKGHLGVHAPRMLETRHVKKDTA